MAAGSEPEVSSSLTLSPVLALSVVGLFTAANASRYPAPALLGSYPGQDLLAVAIRRYFTWSGVRLGSFCRRRATVPLTIGAAIDVPDITKYLLL